MGPLAAGLATIGGGSAVAGGITVATAAVGAYSAYQQIESGKAINREKKAEAVREADSARGEEIERRRALMSVLANRSAQAGAAGITTDGSIGTLTRTDIRNNRNDLLIGGVNSAARQRTLRNQGKNAVRSANANAAVSLLDTADKAYKSAGGGSKKKAP